MIEGTIDQGEWWWGALDPYLQGMAQGMFKLARVSASGFPAFRVAIVQDTEQVSASSFMPDIAFISSFSQAWRIFMPRAHPAPAQRHRVRNVLEAHPFSCEVKRNELAGRAAHVVGTGPSGALAEAIPVDRGDDGPVVVAMNRAVEIVPHADYWAATDPLSPGNHWRVDEWLNLWHRHTRGMHGLFSMHVSPYIRDAVDNCSSYVPCHPDYRQFLDDEEQRELPSIVEGLQTLPGLLHWLWWLGCDPIILWGCDQAREPQGAYYVTPGHDPQDLHQRAWRRVPGVYGEVETTPEHAFAAMQAAAVILWIRDAGGMVYNASRGLDYSFAPAISPDEAVRQGGCADALALASSGRAHATG